MIIVIDHDWWWLMMIGGYWWWLMRMIDIDWWWLIILLMMVKMIDEDWWWWKESEHKDDEIEAVDEDDVHDVRCEGDDANVMALALALFSEHAAEGWVSCEARRVWKGEFWRWKVESLFPCLSVQSKSIWIKRKLALYLSKFFLGHFISSMDSAGLTSPTFIHPIAPKSKKMLRNNL